MIKQSIQSNLVNIKFEDEPNITVRESSAPTNFIEWVNRIALATVFFWFGFLKVVHVSPAEELVTQLHTVTLAKYIPLESFLVILGTVESVIGVLWLLPRCTKLVFWLFIPQMITTFMPLFWLPNVTWQSMLCLTLTGQYIIKNLVLIASAFTVLYLYNTKKGHPGFSLLFWKK